MIHFTSLLLLDTMLTMIFSYMMLVMALLWDAVQAQSASKGKGCQA
jgi:hypothetical protein